MARVPPTQASQGEVGATAGRRAGPTAVISVAMISDARPRGPATAAEAGQPVSQAVTAALRTAERVAKPLIPSGAGPTSAGAVPRPPPIEVLAVTRRLVGVAETRASGGSRPVGRQPGPTILAAPHRASEASSPPIAAAEDPTLALRKGPAGVSGLTGAVLPATAALATTRLAQLTQRQGVPSRLAVEGAPPPSRVLRRVGGRTNLRPLGSTVPRPEVPPTTMAVAELPITRARTGVGRTAVVTAVRPASPARTTSKTTLPTAVPVSPQVPTPLPRAILPLVVLLKAILQTTTVPLVVLPASAVQTAVRATILRTRILLLPTVPAIQVHY